MTFIIIIIIIIIIICYYYFNNTTFKRVHFLIKIVENSWFH